MRSLKKLAEQYIKHKNKGRAEFDKAQEFAKKVIDVAPVGTEITLSNGQVLVVTDNFQNQDVVFRPAGVRRIELLEKRRSKKK